jgi:hypothetical protein
MHSEPISIIEVGSIVFARQTNCIHKAGECGVCFQVYRINDERGYGVIFEGGGFDRFSEQNALSSLEISGEVCATVADYRFKSVRTLVKNHLSGRFAEAFVVIEGEARSG